MRVSYDDTPQDGADAHYSPKALPGMEDAAKPEQGLLWADVGTGRRVEPRKPQERPQPDHPQLF